MKNKLLKIAKYLGQNGLYKEAAQLKKLANDKFDYEAELNSRLAKYEEQIEERNDMNGEEEYDNQYVIELTLEDTIQDATEKKLLEWCLERLEVGENPLSQDAIDEWADERFIGELLPETPEGFSSNIKFIIHSIDSDEIRSELYRKIP